MQLQTVVWLFYGGFGAVASSMLIGLSGYVDIGLVLLCGYRYFCTCFLQHLHKVLCCCSGIDLHFPHQSTFISRRQNVSPSWAVWRLRGPVVLVQMHVVPSSFLAPKDESDLWRSTIFFLRSWLISFDFPMMSSKEALSLKVRWNTSTGTKNDVN